MTVDTQRTFAHRTRCILLATALASASWGCLATTGPVIAPSATRPAVLVMDMQADFLSPGGAMPVAGHQVEPMIEAVNAVTREAARSGTSVFFVANAFSPSDVIGNWFRNDAALAGSSGAQIDERVTLVGPVFHKDMPDAFTNQELDETLRREQVGHLVVVGVFADQCVYWTVRGALNRGYRVSVVADGLGAGDDEALREALDEFRDLGVAVIGLDELVGLLGSRHDALAVAP